jgi:hypothetical protein
MSADCFPMLFRSSSSARDKFLSRLFGIFSEEIVRIWCRAPDAPYEDLGRPTIRYGGRKPATRWTSPCATSRTARSM